MYQVCNTEPDSGIGELLFGQLLENISHRFDPRGRTRTGAPAGFVRLGRWQCPTIIGTMNEDSLNNVFIPALLSPLFIRSTTRARLIQHASIDRQ